MTEHTFTPDSNDPYLLHAEDGGDGPDSDYPHLTEYQAQCLMDMITEGQFAYEEHPVESYTLDDKSAGERVEAADHMLLSYVNALLKERDDEIKVLKTRQITPEMDALVTQIADTPHLTEETMLVRRLLALFAAGEAAR